MVSLLYNDYFMKNFEPATHFSGNQVTQCRYRETDGKHHKYRPAMGIYHLTALKRCMSRWVCAKRVGAELRDFSN